MTTIILIIIWTCAPTPSGLLLSETHYRHQIESDIAPFRGLLLGIFFVTVGFSIDLQLIVGQFPKVFGMLMTLIVGKAAIITTLCKIFGMSLSTSQHTGAPSPLCMVHLNPHMLRFAIMIAFQQIT
jgi:hypothetical protein